jgi:transcriptional regulator with XRE-family HTH domain
LSREDVFLVLELSLKGVTRAELARKFNVSSSTISCIARGKTWRGFESDFKKTNMMEASNV